MQQGFGRERFDAVLFDMDGVVTDTAHAHAAAWKRLFDEYLRARSDRTGEPFVPFDADEDYRRHVDGKSRYDGVRAFLESRGIELPFGDVDDAAGVETIRGLGNRKNALFHDWLGRHRVRIFRGTVRLIGRLREHGVRTAVFSASRNAAAVLESAGLASLFDVRVDGRTAEAAGLPGKPDPAMLSLAAERLGLPAERCAVIEDAIAGVEAGKRGGFAFVIGVDRGNNAAELAARGADLVVSDLAELELSGRGLRLKTVGSLPSVWTVQAELAARLRAHGRAAVLLDYDGTLTPIVEDHRRAFLSEAAREVLIRLAGHCVVAVISGRDLEDVRSLVGLDGIYYSGSHGLELAGPDEWRYVQEDAAAYLPELDAAERMLRRRLEDVPGHAVERKQFSIAVHYRQVEADSALETLERAVAEVAAAHPGLRKGLGKKVIELQPNIQWNKGRAAEQLLDQLGLSEGSSLVVYVGDDLTDEAVFRALGAPSIGVVIRDGDRPTSADYALEDSADVQAFLEWLAGAAPGDA